MTASLDPDRRDELVETLAARLSTWNLSAPAILLLQTHAPLAFLGSQLLYAAQPFVSLVTGVRFARDLACFCEEPANVERLIARLEQR